MPSATHAILISTLAASLVATAPARDEEPVVMASRESAGAGTAAAGPCAAEEAVLANRTRIFTGQGLSPAEQHQRNASEEAALAACRARIEEEQDRKAREEAAARAIEAEIDRVTGPGASPEERRHAADKVRLDRALAKPHGALTPDEAQRVAAFEREQEDEKRKKRDHSRRQDARYMRPALSAMLCYHAWKDDRIRADLDEEARFAKMGSGDPERRYRLEIEARHTEAALSSDRDQLAALPASAIACTDEQIEILWHCIAVANGDEKQDEGCVADDVQEYLRLTR